MKDSKKVFKRLGLLGIGLCTLCCLLPIFAVMFGVGALSVMAAFLEWAGITAMVMALLFSAYYYFKKQKAPACDIDCTCKDKDTLVKAKE
jgi:hypothetical protein